VKGTLHWVSAKHAQKATVRTFESLFCSENPDKPEGGGDFLSDLNPDSLQINTHCFVEPSLTAAPKAVPYQFERLGYFCLDQDSTAESLIFNRTVTLKEAWSKHAKKA